jgi:hypothetical protein
VDNGLVLAGALLILGVGAALVIHTWLTRRHEGVLHDRQDSWSAPSVADAAEEWLRAQDRRSNPTG